MFPGFLFLEDGTVFLDVEFKRVVFDSAVARSAISEGYWVRDVADGRRRPLLLCFLLLEKSIEDRYRIFFIDRWPLNFLIDSTHRLW